MHTKEEIGIVDIEAFEEALEEEEAERRAALEGVQGGRFPIVSIYGEKYIVNGYGCKRRATAEEIRAAEDREWKERAQ